MENFGSTIKTADGSLTLKDPKHLECYHSHGGARWEARTLYVESSGILDSFAQTKNNNPSIKKNLTESSCLSVLDVGLGLGYNACSTIEAWITGPGDKDITIQSLEKQEGLVMALISAQASWQENWPDSWKYWVSKQQLHKNCSKNHYSSTIYHPKTQACCTWLIQILDAHSNMPKPFFSPWHYVWHDPFSPQKNPAMWSPAWFCHVRENSSPECSLLTYSVSRAVKDALSLSGWQIEKIPACGPKKSWLKAKHAKL